MTARERLEKIRELCGPPISFAADDDPLMAGALGQICFITDRVLRGLPLPTSIPMPWSERK
jgi:hypothetical protein